MNVMFLIRSLGYGGAERQLVNLTKGLKGLGHDVAVVTFYSGDPLEKELSDAGIPVWTLGKRGRWDLGKSALRLVRLVREARPSVLHGYLTTANLLTVVAKLFCPSIKVVWGVRASNVDWGSYDWFAKFSFRCECVLSKFADLIIANSHAGREYHLAHGFPAKKVIVIHNGIDTDRFRRDEEAGRRVRQEWGVKEGERLIGHVGRLDPMKDHPTFLHAAALIAKHRDDVRFACVGEGPCWYQSELGALASSLGLASRIIWTGFRKDMCAVYNAFDALVSSSLGEGFPNVIGEAMACGVPCVVTDVGDSALIVGKTGQVISPSNPQALAKGIETTLRDGPEDKTGVFRQRILQSFAAQIMIQAAEKLLKKTAGIA